MGEVGEGCLRAEGRRKAAHLLLVCQWQLAGIGQGRHIADAQGQGHLFESAVQTLHIGILCACTLRVVLEDARCEEGGGGGGGGGEEEEQWMGEGVGGREGEGEREGQHEERIREKESE